MTRPSDVIQYKGFKITVVGKNDIFSAQIHSAARTVARAHGAAFSTLHYTDAERALEAAMTAIDKGEIARQR
jgi:hypothetical protein